MAAADAAANLQGEFVMDKNKYWLISAILFLFTAIIQFIVSILSGLILFVATGAAFVCIGCCFLAIYNKNRIGNKENK